MGAAGAPVVEAVGLTRDFVGGATPLRVLRGIDLRVDPGEMVAVMGPSGSGKSTLLNILGCLDRPSSGVYRLDGVAVEDLDDDALARVRNERLGFVFQGFNLLARTSALDNVMLPMLYDRSGRFPVPPARARAALDQVGLGDRLDHHPNQLSGGQQQRVAIARALVTGPSLLLADEPTGNLDSVTTEDVLALFQDLHGHGHTLVIVTHEMDVAEHCTRRVVVRDGAVVEDVPIGARRRVAHAGPPA